MAESIKISVIIPVYNTETYLAECLDSVCNQTLRDIEIICVNDGSSDDSLKILNRYARKDSRITILNQDNYGVVSARNNGIAIAKAKYIYPLDSDDVIAPDCLEKLYNVIQAGKGDIITCRVMCFGCINKEMELKDPTKQNMCKHNCLVNAALFRKKDFEKSGGYDHKFDMGLEDYDLWLNMMFRHNKKLYRVPEILFYYRIKDQKESRNIQSFSKLDVLWDTIRKKYPKMRFYMLLYKMLKVFRKIRRFFFRIEGRNVKIFKIPVYMMKKRGVSWAHWFNTCDNFGDLLNPYLFQYFGRKLIHSDVSSADIIGIGSLMEALFSKKMCKKIRRPLIVYGTGFIKAQDGDMYLKRNLNVRAVRGYNTLARLRGVKGVKFAKNIVIADPGLLAPVLLDGKMPKKKYKLGIIPHYVDVDSPLLKKITCKDVTVIDITSDPISFMKKIAECENVISSAMHGLIAADSLGIPNIRMIISDKIVGGDYKYNDYYSAFGVEQHNRVDLRTECFTEQDVENLQNTYQINKEQVRRKQVELIKAFPYPIKRKICL